MATAEDVQEARERIEDARLELTLEKERLTSAARGSETDVELELLRREEARLAAEIEVVRADADHQERAVGLLPPLEAPAPVTEDASDTPADTGQGEFPFSGTLYGGDATNGDDITGRD